jgi:hypothetical protein
MVLESGCTLVARHHRTPKGQEICGFLSFSTRLLSEMSQVQVLPGSPIFRKFFKSIAKPKRPKPAQGNQNKPGIAQF